MLDVANTRHIDSYLVTVNLHSTLQMTRGTFGRKEVF